MSLADLRFLQDPNERSTYDYAHHQEHLTIAQAIKSVLGITVPVLALHPVSDPDAWARQHQQMHDDMNRACKTAGQDLTGNVFGREWTDRNFMEHAAVKQVLGI